MMKTSQHNSVRINTKHSFLHSVIGKEIFVSSPSQGSCAHSAYPFLHCFTDSGRLLVSKLGIFSLPYNKFIVLWVSHDAVGGYT